MQNCIGSFFCPLFHNLFLLKQRCSDAKRSAARFHARRAPRYLPVTMSLKRRAGGHDPSGSFSNTYIPIYARSHRAQQAYIRHIRHRGARTHTTDTTHSMQRGLRPAEHNGHTRNTTVHPKPPKQANPAARFATHCCPRAPGPVSTTIEGVWHQGASGRGPSARTIGSPTGPRPS